MLDQVTVITFAATPIHRRLANEFEAMYADHFGNYHCYTAEWLAKQPFYKDNPQVFRYAKYHGYFLWKPFIIQRALQSGAKFILYCDSNLRFLDYLRFETAFQAQIASQGVFLIKYSQHANSRWTKRDAFVLMDADNSRYHGARQVWSVIQGYSKWSYSHNLLSEYLEYCRDPHIVTEEPNACRLPNLPDFEAHRWEQSVLSILAEKYSVECVDYMQAYQWIDKVYPADLVQYKAGVEPLAVRDV